MLQHPDFDTKDIDPNLHERMAKAVDDGRIKCFNLREGPADGRACTSRRWLQLFSRANLI